MAAPGLSRQGQATKEARTADQDFKVRIYLPLRYDRQIDAVKFIESINDDDQK